MPVYNCEKYITQAIESVLAQTYKNFEKINPYLSPLNIKHRQIFLSSKPKKRVHTCRLQFFRKKASHEKL